MSRGVKLGSSSSRMAVRLGGRNPHYTSYEQVPAHVAQKIIAESKKEPEKD